MHVLATSVKSKHNFFKGHLHIIYTNEFWDSIVFCIWKKPPTLIVLFKTKMKTTNILQTSLWLRHYAQFLCESLPSKRDCACTFIIHVAHQSRCIGRLLTNSPPYLPRPDPLSPSTISPRSYRGRNLIAVGRDAISTHCELKSSFSISSSLQPARVSTNLLTFL